MISKITLSNYAFFSFPLAAAFIVIQVLIPTHYAQVTTLSLTTIGAVILLARLWDTITDPLIGFMSDSTPQHWGRRKLWLWLSVPIISISTYKLFNPHIDAGIAYLLFWTFAIYLSGTMAIVPLTSWGAELSTNYNERNRITGARAFYGLLGTLAALLIPALFTESNATNGDTLNLSEPLSIITTLIILSLFIAALGIFFVSDQQTVKLPANQIRAAFDLIRTPSPFRTLLISFLFNSIANAIPATLFLFYISDILKTPDYAGPLLFLYFIFSALSIPFWIAIANKFGKQRTWTCSIIVACIFFFATPFLNENLLYLYFIIVIVTGFTTGCDLIIPSSMNGDLIEWDASTSGYKRPGLFFALWGTTTKLAFALAIGLAFPLLDLFGFTANENNDTQALTALAWMYGLPCIFFKLLALFCMRNYPITESEYASILEKTKN